MRLASAMVIGTLLFACNKRGTEGENISKPVDIVASAKPSASAAPIVVAVTQPACENGVIKASGDGGVPPAASVDPDGGVSGFGGLGLSGVGGVAPSGGIGLGTLGGTGFSGGLGALGELGGGVLNVTLKGQALAASGFAKSDVELTMCAAYPTFMRCVEDAATSANDLDGTLGLALAIAPDGKATATVVGGSLEDEKLRKCFLDAATSIIFEPDGMKSASLTYAFSAHRPRKPKVIKVVETGTTVTGRLPPEVIRRIIRANLSRLRYCYEKELKTDPTLQGTVVTKFVIGEKGNVESVTPDGGTMGNANVQTCVTKAFKTLAFPEPEGGKVLVTYPVSFSPG